jgi:hypothetical protein
MSRFFEVSRGAISGGTGDDQMRSNAQAASVARRRRSMAKAAFVVMARDIGAASAARQASRPATSALKVN